MKGNPPTVEQKRFHDMLCSRVGCIACLLDGTMNSYCSVHHIDGRTKPMAQWLVLPLCGGHHQDRGGRRIAVHPWKTRFEARYGTQQYLLQVCVSLLINLACVVPSGALLAAGIDREE
jgi:hypothetical protein